jgi:lysozyme
VNLEVPLPRKINDAGLALVKSFEGLRLEAYRCPAGVLTIGYGSTGPHVREGMTITPGEAERYLMLDLRRFETGVEDLVGEATDNQFSAMVSLAYNIGFGDPDRDIPGFKGSTVLKRHLLKNYVGAGNAFLMWKKANGRVLPGLIRRREAERKLYLS